MSKIGTKPVKIIESTEITLKMGAIEVKGKEGTMSVSIPRNISVLQQDNELVVKRDGETKKIKLHRLKK